MLEHETNEIFKLGLHDMCQVRETEDGYHIDVMRVPGGWIYMFISYYEKGENLVTQFVPDEVEEKGL